MLSKTYPEIKQVKQSKQLCLIKVIYILLTTRKKKQKTAQHAQETSGNEN